MQDLSAAIGGILGSEEGMAQLRSMAAALGLPPNGQAQPQPPQPSSGPPSPQPPPAAPPAGSMGADLAGLITQLQAALQSNTQKPAPPQPAAPAPPQGSPLPGVDLSTLLKLRQAYAGYTAPDKNTDLLRAIKPHLSEKRQQKVDDAIRILGLVKLLPMLQESGLLENLGGLIGGERR